MLLMTPYPGPLSVLVMDNAHIHHGDEILELADCFSIRIEYLPPYSPDLNPIEEAFSQVKTYICRNNDIFLSSSSEDLMFDMHQAFNIVTNIDAMGYFIHAGYF